MSMDDQSNAQTPITKEASIPTDAHVASSNPASRKLNHGCRPPSPLPRMMIEERDLHQRGGLAQASGEFGWVRSARLRVTASGDYGR